MTTLKIFDNMPDAEKLCSEIHKYLQKNCPDYSASLWQIPSKAEKSEQYAVQLPDEFVKDFYPVSEKISVTCKPFTNKAKLTVEKLPPDWTPVSIALLPDESKGLDLL